MDQRFARARAAPAHRPGYVYLQRRLRSGQSGFSVEPMGPLRTVTALFTDLAGSTGIEARVGPMTAEELRVEYFAVMREVLAETGGREVKTTGDGLMAVFPSVSGAVDCAVAIEQRIERRNAHADEPLGVRVGLNLGDATVEDGDYFGLAVNTAARLCDAADPGQILTS